MGLDYVPLPGTPRNELDTPCLYIDLAAMERNIHKMAAYLTGVGIACRPHAKTSKCPAICLQQIAAGAAGVCAAKLGEAEALAAGGVRDIFITTEVVGPAKIARLMALARAARVMVAVDDAGNVATLSAAARRLGVKLGAVIEVNVRLNRCGVEPGQPAVELAKVITDAPGLRFAGLMGYEGSLRALDLEQRAVEARQAVGKVVRTREMIEQEGLPVQIVSAGSTSTWNITSAIPGVTEIQPGTYVLMDGATRRHTPDFEHALFLLAGVISRPFRGKAIIDVGLTAVSTDAGMPDVVWPPGASLVRLDQEHGHLALEGEAEMLRPGDRIVLLPAHGDTTINLHDYYFGLRDDMLESVLPITGRGRFR